VAFAASAFFGASDDVAACGASPAVTTAVPAAAVCVASALA
jgi:hypothetical protein